MIKINGVACQFVNFGGIDLVRKNGTKDYLFLFFRTDTELMLHGKYQLVKKNTFLIYPKDTPQMYRKTDGDFVNDWMHFDLDSNQYFQKLNIPLETPIFLHSHRTINLMMYDLLDEYISVGFHHNRILEQKADIMFHKFSDLYQSEKNNTSSINQYRESLSAIRNRIYHQHETPDRIMNLVEELNMSLSYLEHLYKKIFGVSINQDIIQSRINHACNLLDHTEYSMSEIAMICGYNSLEHFSRQFKSRVGCSPSKYKKGI